MWSKSIAAVPSKWRANATESAQSCGTVATSTISERTTTSSAAMPASDSRDASRSTQRRPLTSARLWTGYGDERQTLVDCDAAQQSSTSPGNLGTVKLAESALQEASGTPSSSYLSIDFGVPTDERVSSDQAPTYRRRRLLYPQGGRANDLNLVQLAQQDRDLPPPTWSAPWGGGQSLGSVANGPSAGVGRERLAQKRRSSACWHVGEHGDQDPTALLPLPGLAVLRRVPA